MANEDEKQNVRNPTQRFTVREALKQDITDHLQKALKNASKKNYHAAILDKEQADTLFVWGIRRGILDENDRILFYGDRHLKGGKDEYVPGIFPEEMEAKCRAAVDYDEVEMEVIRRVSNILNRALVVITSRADRMAAKRIFDEIPRV